LLPCLVIGDSIAVGVGQNLPECKVTARVGISSQGFIQQMLTDERSGTTVISLGANDNASATTAANLIRVRGAVQSRRVFWLLPSRPREARGIIRAVARQFGDQCIDSQPVAGPDGLHPTGTGYRLLAEQVKARKAVR
jgi:lysophospholipase L1-like esterase